MKLTFNSFWSKFSNKNFTELDNITINEVVIKAITYLKNKKSPGSDALRNEIFKIGIASFASILSKSA